MGKLLNFVGLTWTLSALLGPSIGHPTPPTENENQVELIKSLNFNDGQGNSALHLAVLGLEELVTRRLIWLGAPVNARNDHQETPLITVANVRQDMTKPLSIINYLIRHGADLFAVDDSGQTFIHKLVSRGSTLSPSEFHSMAELILAKNASTLFNVQDQDGRTPLMLAAKYVKMEAATVDLLLTNDAVNFYVVDLEGKSVLHYVFEGNRNMDLFDNFSRGMWKFTSLESEILGKNPEAVEYFIKERLDVNKIDGRSQTPLILAAMSEDKTFSMKVIKLLNENGADVTAKDDEGYTFLYRLVDDGSTLTPRQFHDMTAFLISKNLSHAFSGTGTIWKNVQTPTWNYRYGLRSPLQLAVKNIEMEKDNLALLQENGLNLNMVDSEGGSLLAYAILGERSAEMVENLISFGVDPNYVNSNQQNYLHLAAETGNVEHLKFFLDLGLDINALDYSNKTPLHRAVIWGYKNALANVRFLIENGANVNTRDGNGNSPMDSAMRRFDLPERRQLLQLIESKLT